MNGFLDKKTNPVDICGFEYRESKILQETRVVTLALIACVLAAAVGVAVWGLSYQVGWV